VPPALAALLALALAVAAGCGADEGGDAEQPDTATSASPSTETAPSDIETAPSEAEPAPTEPETDGQGKTTPDEPGSAPPDDPGGARRSPEQRAGGVGDELPALSEALFSGRGGRVVPPVVRVPPFIAIRARLRSADGADYVLRAGNRTLRASGDDSASAAFDGLRPGRRIVLDGPNGRVVIEASAEPGP